MSTIEMTREELRERLHNSVEAQDELMMMDVAKILHKLPEGSSVVALRNYHGTVMAGVVVPNGDITLAVELFRKGHLNPDSSPGLWRLIPESKLPFLSIFPDAPEAALGFFVLTSTRKYAFAYSHLLRTDGDVQWISDAEWINRVAEVLLDVGLFETNV